MLGEKTARFRLGRRGLLGAALILVVTAGLRAGVTVSDRAAGSERHQANGASRAERPARPVRADVAPPAGEMLASAVAQAPAVETAVDPVADPVAPPASPVASPPSEPMAPQPIRAAESRPGPGPWVASAGPLAPAAPVRVEIPSVGITAPIVPLGLNRDGTLEVPSVFSQAGWYTGRPTPGETGPAIIVAHRSSRRGPGAFWHLPDVQPGQEVVVSRADGSRVGFVVERLEQHPKSAFPTEAVYGPTPETALRLITCGGPFEPSLGDRYRDNIIVFARMTGTAG